MRLGHANALRQLASGHRASGRRRDLKPVKGAESYQPVVRAVIEIFEPASERGRAGLAELQRQTHGLLSFKTLEKTVYDTQVSFALVPAYGEKSA